MSREHLISGGIVLVIILVIVAGLWGRRMDEVNKSVTQSPNNPISMNTNSDSSSLKIEDLTVGTGFEATAGAKISVNYKGTLIDGTEFDSSYKRNQPFQFVLGAGQVIAGWDQGFAGMKVGGKRRLTIPPWLGYGDRQVGTIPPNSTLVFEVELLAVQ